MKIKNYQIFYLFICVLCCNVHSSMGEQVKADSYLSTKGEVYFKFDINSRNDIVKFTKTTSIDKIVGNTIYAYANSSEFTSFLNEQCDFEVLAHPGDLAINPAMSDYSDESTWGWNKYPTFEGYVKIMNIMAKAHPDLCKIIDIGESVMGRRLLVAKISDNVELNEKEPEFFSTATIHGDETVGYMLMLRMIYYLLNSYGKDDRITRIVDSMVIYISPLSNPDGTFRNDNSTVKGATRENANNVDLNRNYPDPVKGWNEKSWEKETRAFIEFEEKHNFVLSTDIHGGVKVVCYPWGCIWENIIADDNWYVHVSKEYAENVRANSPENYLNYNTEGIINGTDWYGIVGGRMSYLPYFRGCRVLTLELSDPKLVKDSLLNVHWDYNKEALISFFEQTLCGVRGNVVDKLTQAPLKAKIFISNHDKDSSHVYSYIDNGDYYRPLYQGVYDITYSCDGYISKTISKVKVKNNNATIVNVALCDITKNNIINSITNAVFDIKIIKNNIMVLSNNINKINSLSIYSVNGKLINTIENNSVNKNGILICNLANNGELLSEGCYIIRINTTNNVYMKNFIISR